MKMYCIVSREALKAMNGNRGKLAAQAGHAYLHAYWDAEDYLGRPVTEVSMDQWRARKDLLTAYRKSGKATKVCLVVETTDELRVLEAAYRPVCGVSLVTDAGLTCFDGVPTVTCLGIGPIRDEDVGDDLKALKVLI
jgi:peptidyl-tRNA hydrolase